MTNGGHDSPRREPSNDERRTFAIRRDLVVALARMAERLEAHNARVRRRRRPPPTRRVALPPPATTWHEADRATSRRPPERELHSALEQWNSATSRRDFDAQMAFYPPRVSAFYLARDVPRIAIEAEKRRVFEHADVIDIHTGEPDIAVDPMTRTARMRFRKRYVISGPRIDRRGEVVQELRWIETVDGWKIDSERDMQVVRRDPAPILSRRRS